MSKIGPAYHIFRSFFNRYIFRSLCIRLACCEKRVYNCFFLGDSSFFSTNLYEIFAIFVERNLKAFIIWAFAVSCNHYYSINDLLFKNLKSGITILLQFCCFHILRSIFSNEGLDEVIPT